MQEKYDQVWTLIDLGKDRGFLLFDEVFGWGTQCGGCPLDPFQRT